MSLAHRYKQHIVHCQKKKLSSASSLLRQVWRASSSRSAMISLVAAHDSSMELVQSSAPTGDRELPLSRKPSNKTAAANSSNSPSLSFIVAPKATEKASTLIRRGVRERAREPCRVQAGYFGGVGGGGVCWWWWWWWCPRRDSAPLWRERQLAHQRDLRGETQMHIGFSSGCHPFVDN